MRSKRRAAEKADGEDFVGFDVLQRNTWLTGFRKRKALRRQEAYEKFLEKERQEKIDAKREYRQELKAQYKRIQLESKRVERLLDAKHGAPKAIQDGEADKENDEDEDADGVLALMSNPAEPAAAKGGTTVVAFDREDDDPFGDCEVTTSAVPCSALEVFEVASGTLAVREPTEHDPEHAARRRANLAKEEARRREALAKRAKRRILLDKREKKRKGKKARAKTNSGKAKKTTHGERRKRAAAQKRKG